MKWKLFRRKMTVSAPRVTVRTHVPWPLRAVLGFVVLVFAAAAGVGIYEYGRQFGGPDRRELVLEVDRLQSQLRETKSERDRAQAVAAAYESQMKIERATQDQLLQQVAMLENEAAKLREDLSFFESLLPTPAGAKGVVVRSFRVQQDGEPNQLRYRLLVQQSGKADRDFVGAVQLQIHFLQGGRPYTMDVPEPAPGQDAAGIDLSFRHYQRVEGTFTLPEGAVARSVIVRILAGGQPHSQQTFPI
ncbi:MAG TPA: DUF6776 family protein [Burkholderiaceae bacterium]|nr:DUF6776 family protein [Burkholderiaceae bacterium]